MKGVFVIAVLAGTVGLSAQPVRMVGNFKVDLGPVMEWLHKEKGDRPMPHWKKIQFTESYGIKNGALEVDATIDGVGPKRILIWNVPKPINDLLARRAVIRYRLNMATAASDHADAVATQAAGQVDSGWYASGSQSFVNSVAAQKEAQKQAAARAAAIAQLTEAQRQRLEAELKVIETELAKVFDVAMFTGRQFVGRELWDCGRPAK